MRKEYICVYDSGIGGLTTLSELIKIMPNENYLYFADNRNCPYGNKSKYEIEELVNKNLNWLLKRYNIKMLVFACNTVTATCVENVRNKYNFNVVGIEPAIKLALKHSKNKRVVAIMTNATMNQEKYKLLLGSVNGKVINMPLTNLAREIEENKLFNKTIDLNYYNDIIKSLIKENNADVLVLGCTHYVFFKKDFQKLLNIKVYDGNLGVAKRVKNLIGDRNSYIINGELKFVLTKTIHNQKKKYKKLLKSLENR